MLAPQLMAGLVVAYFAVLGALALVGIQRLVLVLAAKLRTEPVDPDEPDRWPRALIQLPMYNERFVVERLLNAVAAMAYPPDRLTVQVLDDSTDDTRWIVERSVERLKSQGVPVEVVRRPDRAGYKAGALAHGLARSNAEVVAIFDSDFVPEPDFLVRCVARLMTDANLGLVQARWGHLNRDASWLTRAQAVFLDGHFEVEHAGREELGHPFNFNGTAGVWRRAAIDGAGGWTSDTITEDLDLSYRAQLAGWRFAYVSTVVAPAELPESIAAYRSQQARWVRGSVETARKLALPVVRARNLNWHQRLGGLFHLTNNAAYVAMALLSGLLPAAVIGRDQAGWRVFGGEPLLSALDLTNLLLGTTVMFAFYAVGVARAGAGGWRRLFDVCLALCLGAGMSLANAREVFVGLRSRGSTFIRTPKRGGHRPVCYERGVAWRRVAPELLMASVHASTMVYAWVQGLWGALPFLALFLVGFSMLAGSTIREAWARRRSSVAVVRQTA